MPSFFPMGMHPHTSTARTVVENSEKYVSPDGFFDIQILPNSVSARTLLMSLPRSDPLVTLLAGGWGGYTIPTPVDAFSVSLWTLLVYQACPYFLPPVFSHSVVGNPKCKQLFVVNFVHIIACLASCFSF